MKVSIVLPAYRCEPDMALIRLLFPRAEIIVVKDANGAGKGATLRRGSERATGDYVVWLDGDMEIPPEQIFDYLVAAQSTDIVVASKMHRASSVNNYGLTRKLCTVGYYLLIKVLFNLPVKDTQTGLKVFRREVLDRVLPLCKVDGYSFDIEVLAYAQALGYSMRDLPVRIEGKESSSVKLFTIGRMLWNTLKTRLRLYNFTRKNTPRR